MFNNGNYKLGDIGKFKGGISTLDKLRYDKGINFVNYMDVFQNSTITLNSKLRKYDATKSDIEKYNLIYGDALFTASSELPNEIAISSIYLSNKKAIFNGFCKRFRYNHRILIPKYAAYLFRSNKFRSIATRYATGYTRYNISQESLNKINFNIPSINEQQKIIDIIEPIENLIIKLSTLIFKLFELIKNLPTFNFKTNLKKFCNLIKYPPKNLKQISAKVLKTQLTSVSRFEKKQTYETNTFFTPKNTLVINTIRTYLRKFAIIPDNCDSTGTMAHIKVNSNLTSIIHNLNRDFFWNQLDAFSSGTKMPVISKFDLFNKISLFQTKFEIKGLNIFSISNLLILELNKIKEKIIKLLIK